MIETHARTEIGRQCDHNEDFILDTQTHKTAEEYLLAVADGMGGHRAGDIASEEAIKAFANAVTVHDGTPENRLSKAINDANDHLQKMVAADSQLEGMGTTLVAALVNGKEVTLINVGDSRAYHISDEINQITTDQSLVQELVKQGVIEPEEAANHPQRNILSQALGTKESIEPDTYEVTLEGVLLLCSDGLSDELPETTMRTIVSEAKKLDTAAEELIAQANEMDGSDNISVVLARPAGGYG